MVKHGLLAGMCDVDAAKSHPAGVRQQRTHVSRRKPELVDVDQLIEAPQSLRASLTLVQGRAQRCADAGTYQANEVPGGVSYRRRHAVSFAQVSRSSVMPTVMYDLVSSLQCLPCGMSRPG